jgi:preprotein translocase subunit YajC
MIINNANGQASTQTQDAAALPAPEFSFASFVPLILIFVVFYFLIIRPQSKKLKDHQNMTNNLKIGNKVLTNSGIIGIVKEIDQTENIVDIEISRDVIVKMPRNYVAELIKNEKTTHKK